MRKGDGTNRKVQMTRLIRTNRPNGRAQTRAFTAIELLVVLGVVILLVALVVVAVGGSRGGTREARTRLTFQTLLAVGDEYSVVTAGDVINHDGVDPLNWGENRAFTNPDKSGSGNPDDTIERFVVAAMQNPETVDLIVNLTSGDVLVDTDGTDGSGDGFLEIRDGWGGMIEYRSVSDPSDNWPDHPSPFFSSAGDDGEFGTDRDLHSFTFE